MAKGGARPTLDDRIASGGAPASAADIDAAIAHEGEGTGRALTWALAHRLAFGADVAARVEDAATRYLASSYRGALVELVGALHVYWPRGLLAPRVRGAIHLAIELDVLGAQDLFLVLQPLLAVEERFDAYVRHAQRRPLGARIRVASLGRGVALAASYVGLGAILPGDRADDFARVLERLYTDRDPVVGVRAAWAVGALARHSERFARIIDDKASAGLAGRRAMVAKTARWILGDLDEERYLTELRKGIGKSDVFVRATAVQAMQLGLRVAPATTAAIVETLIDRAAPEVLLAAAAFAWAIDEPDRRASLLDRVRVEAERRGGSDAALRFWTGPREGTVDGLHQALLGLRNAVHESPRDAHDASTLAIDRARRAVDALRAEGDDDVDHALDALLLDSPLLRDAATASASTDAERTRRYRAWAATIERLRDRRVARAATPGIDAASHRDRLRRLARGLDAHPRVDATGNALPMGPLHAACRTVVTSLLAQPATKEARDASLERPRALAIAAAIEPLIEHEEILGTEIVAALLALDAVALAKHLAAAVTSAPLAEGLRATVALREAIDDAEASIDAPRARRPSAEASATKLDPAVRAFAATMLSLGALDPLADAAHALADAVTSTTEGVASIAPWSAAITRLDAAIRAAAPRFDLPLPAPLVTAKLDRALYSRFVHAAIVPFVASDPPFGADRATRQIVKALPPMLARIVEATVHAAKTSRGRPTLAAPKARGVVAMGPGWRIGDYVVERVLGAGGMGRCVLVRRRLEESQKNARRWVLKLPQSEEFSSAFRNEALALLFLSKANHPSIVRFVGYVDYGYRLPYLVMEYVPGEALDRRLLRGGLPPAELYAVGAQLANGIATSHSMHIAHHDIKPANIILADGDVPRPILVDWGLAGAAYPWAGTPEYMAAERYVFGRGKKTATGGAPNPPAADIFALGCVLAELHSGHTLLAGPLAPADVGADVALLETYRRLEISQQRDFACEILATHPPMIARRLALAMRDADPRLVALIERTLARRREDRPTAKDVAHELDALKRSVEAPKTPKGT